MKPWPCDAEKELSVGFSAGVGCWRFGKRSCPSLSRTTLHHARRCGMLLEHHMMPSSAVVDQLPQIICEALRTNPGYFVSQFLCGTGLSETEQNASGGRFRRRWPMPFDLYAAD
jgi:hypothetical protein